MENLLQSHRILPDGLPSLLLAGLCGLEALGEPEAPLFVTAFSGGHHPHADAGQHRQSGQHQVDRVELLSGLAVHATWQERGHRGEDGCRRWSGWMEDASPGRPHPPPARRSPRPTSAATSSEHQKATEQSTPLGKLAPRRYLLGNNQGR